ncbi:MAG: hypothetical protein K0S23_3663 [Fluviicola sp.]|jgi:hypothetical protein|uniref:hypothetical protein n=1 Tax=Fluviicola sp. TaxID=1917219 RepID=UPI002638B5BA|nr:hypothetical protein [Fluviicola sp.]MDF3029356.1 hypothetical protein [Fluviicola sp.]
MYVIERESNLRHQVKVKPLDDEDYKEITKSRFYFNWKTERAHDVYKLVLGDEILGVMSCRHHEDERIEIVLLAVSKDNRGRNKKYDRITGNLIGFACKEAMKYYGINGCVSLVPKTSLRQHYMDFYGMEDAGRQIFLEGGSLLNILREYEL